MSSRGWTVVERLRFLGREPEPELCWSIGQDMERWFRSAFGTQPPKELRPKTYDGGSHCFAVYYSELSIGKLDELIALHAAQAARQLQMGF